MANIFTVQSEVNSSVATAAPKVTKDDASEEEEEDEDDDEGEDDDEEEEEEESSSSSSEEDSEESKYGDLAPAEIARLKIIKRITVSIAQGCI